MVIGFLFTPFLGRIYGPNEYGIFALISSIVLNLSPLSTLSFEQAMILPKSRRSYYSLIGLNLFFLFSSTFIVLIIIVAIDFTDISLGADIDGAKSLIYFIPVLLVVNVLCQFITNISVRRDKHSIVASGRISSIVVTKFYAIFHGLFVRVSALGFIISDVIGKVIFISTCLINPTNRSDLIIGFRSISTGNMKSIFKEFINYPIFVFPAILTSSLYAQLPVYFFSWLFTPYVVGLYSMSSSLLMIPMAMVGRSIGTVFYQRAAECYNSGDLQHLRKISIILISRMIILCIPFALLMIFWGEQILLLVLGSDWIDAAEYVRIMVLYFSFEMVAFPLVSLFKVLRKEKLLFRLNFSSLIIICVALYFGYLSGDPITSIYLITISRILEMGLKIVFILFELKREASASNS